MTEQKRTGNPEDHLCSNVQQVAFLQLRRVLRRYFTVYCDNVKDFLLIGICLFGLCFIKDIETESIEALGEQGGVHDVLGYAKTGTGSNVQKS